MDVRYFVNGRLVSKSEQDATKTMKPQEKLKEQVEVMVQSQPLAVISVGNCPQCEELAALLAARGVPASVFIKWDRQSAEYASLKASLARHAGEVFSFPQVFMKGAYQGGFKEVVDKLDQGVYDELFEREFDATPVTLQRMVDRRAMVVFSLPNCPNCDVLREDLSARKVPVQDIFVKLDKAQPEYPSLKAQLQRLIGRDNFAFPQTFIRGVYQGNFDEVIAKANKNEYADVFSDEFGIAAPEPACVAAPIGAISFDDDF